MMMSNNNQSTMKCPYSLSEFADVVNCLEGSFNHRNGFCVLPSYDDNIIRINTISEVSSISGSLIVLPFSISPKLNLLSVGYFLDGSMSMVFNLV